jgi:hypothetical protein
VAGDPRPVKREKRVLAETHLLLRLEKVMSFVVSELKRFLNGHVLRLAFSSPVGAS